uniref:metal ABC transporter permease n=1 Tax=Aliarcobacter sp. TaxID=2321116 RepID=UPI0040480B86
MLESLSYTFIQNALIAGILVSIITGIIGSLIVVNKMVFLSGGIAHSAYGGIGVSIYFGIPMLLSTSIFSVLITFLIAILTYQKRENLDTIIGLTWAIGMSFGILLVDLTPGYNSDLMSYLFGSILAVNNDDILFMSVLLGFIVLTLLLFYRDILAVSYDNEYANLRGIKTRFFYTLILILSALSIVIAIKIVGLILVIALLTIPIYIAQRFCNTLISMMIVSGVFSMIFTIFGLIVSYIYDLSSGPSIILVSSICMFGVIIFQFLRKKVKPI